MYGRGVNGSEGTDPQKGTVVPGYYNIQYVVTVTKPPKIVRYITKICTANEVVYPGALVEECLVHNEGRPLGDPNRILLLGPDFEMSFSIDKETIAEGDTAILYLSAAAMHAIRVVPNIKNKHGDVIDNVFQTTYGALKVASLIGVKYGSKVGLSKGWAFVLQPNPELWTLTLPHRTQIVYTPDISNIVFQLEIHPGSFVIESGTGSGSLTHALARRVQPNGTVKTFDFHEQRAQTAKEEFEGHGLSPVVQVSRRDVCQEGFGPEVEGKADAVFLDLPHPWMVVPHAVGAFKAQGGRFCSFSPCIEQVQRTCSALRDAGFFEVSTIECLQREILVNSRSFPVANVELGTNEEKCNLVCSNYSNTMPGHTGYLTFATLPPVWSRNTSAVSEVECEETGENS